MQKSNKFNFKPRPVAKNCPFCHTHTEPEYKDVSVMSKYLSERGKILGKSRTGVCSRHQRAITTAIKHARHVALLPFITRA